MKLQQQQANIQVKSLKRLEDYLVEIDLNYALVSSSFYSSNYDNKNISITIMLILNNNAKKEKRSVTE